MTSILIIQPRHIELLRNDVELRDLLGEGAGIVMLINWRITAYVTH